jgi:hypothetical protein
MYWELRKKYHVEWRNDEVPNKIRQTSLPQPVRRYSMKNLKRIKDMNLERVVDIIIEKKLRDRNRETIKIPIPADLLLYRRH